MICRAPLCLGLTGLCLIALASRYDDGVSAQTQDRPRLTVKLVQDFEVTGTGEHTAWQQAEWTSLRRRQPDGHPYDSRFKVVYSSTGLYFLMEGTDRKLTATMNEDFMDLWNEDVFEVFLWTDERYPVYFEYEISPLNRELPILIPNFGGQFLGWRPWHYEGDRQTRKATSYDRGPEAVAGLDSGMARRVLHPVHVAEAAAERATQGRHPLARELLPHGPRRRAEHAVGVGAGGQELPRVPEVRRPGVRGSLSHVRPSTQAAMIPAEVLRVGRARVTRARVSRHLVNAVTACYDRVFGTFVRSRQYVPIVQRPRTPAFHAGNAGSNPAGDASLRSPASVSELRLGKPASSRRRRRRLPRRSATLPSAQRRAVQVNREVRLRKQH